jgi:hypothetical protein
MSYRLGAPPAQKALYLDGGSDKAHYTATSTGVANLCPEPDEAFSVFLWVRGSRQTDHGYFAQSVTSSAWEGWYIKTETSTNALGATFAANVSGSNRYLTAAGPANSARAIDENDWAHIGFTIDGTGNTSGIAVYCNGEVVPTTNTLSAGTAAEFRGGTVTAQATGLGFTNWDDGNIFVAAHFAVFEGALSASQVREIYNGKGNKPGFCDLRNMLGGASGITLRGYWLYGNPADTSSTLQDGTTNNFDLTCTSISEGQLLPARV